MVFRQKPKKADYVLYINANNPIAIVEAKDNKHTASHGLQQAMIYAQMMGIPFAYSSNGDAFMEHDFLTGQERQIPMDQFPSPDELYGFLAPFKVINITTDISDGWRPYNASLRRLTPSV